MRREFALYRRVGRFFLWQFPSFYRVFGILRSRGDCCADDFDIWIDGFPRSAQTFATKSFVLANPNAKVRSHQHLPPFIINAIQAGKPGMLMIRKPIDAAVSWAIFWDRALAPCLDYYIDFHRALLPHAGGAFIARFEEVTTDFGSLVQQFNQRIGTSFSGPTQDPESIFSLIEAETNWGNPEFNSRRVCRPSSARAGLKAELMRELATSSRTARKLDKAMELYHAFIRQQPVSAKPRLNHDTRQLPV